MVDLAQPVTVDGRLPSAAPDRVRMSLSMGGIGVGEAEGEAEVQPDGTFAATLDLAGSRYVAAGRTTGTVTLLRAGERLAAGRLGIRSSRPGVLSLPGAVAIAAALFLAAYAESVLRLVRRGRRRRTGVATLVLLGGPLGCALALVAALAGAREPTVVTMVLAGLAGGGAGLLAGRAGFAVGRFRRLARAAKSARR